MNMELSKLESSGAIAPPMPLEEKVKTLNQLLQEARLFRACVAHAFEILPDFGFPLQVRVDGDPRIAHLSMIARKKIEGGEPLSARDFWYSIS